MQELDYEGEVIPPRKGRTGLARSRGKLIQCVPFNGAWRISALANDNVRPVRFVRPASWEGVVESLSPIPLRECAGTYFGGPSD